MKEKLMEALARTVALKAESNERMEKIGPRKETCRTRRALALITSGSKRNPVMKALRWHT
jgi:hypothetical protein